MRLAIFGALVLVTSMMFGHNVVNVVADKAPWLLVVGFGVAIFYWTRHLIEMIEHDES
jgi:hypothetical protein